MPPGLELGHLLLMPELHRPDLFLEGGRRDTSLVDACKPRALDLDQGHASKILTLRGGGSYGLSGNFTLRGSSSSSLCGSSGSSSSNLPEALLLGSGGSLDSRMPAAFLFGCGGSLTDELTLP